MASLADRVAMNHTTRPSIPSATFGRVRLAAIATSIVVMFLAVSTAASAAVSPAAYRVARLCTAPGLGHAGCLGLRLVAKHPAAQPGVLVSTPAGHSAPQGGRPGLEKVEQKNPWPGSFSPANVLGAYGLAGLPSPTSTQTLALVDAYNDPTIEHDLEVFDTQYALPACTTVNGCFAKVEMLNKGKGPANEPGWAEEISTDVELAHGLCPECKILLVEAHSNSNPDLEAAELKAEELGATEISNSWGGPELGITVAEDEHGAFNDPGTVITASAGDEGYLDWDAEEAAERGYVDYPASSPYVVAVGGTRLTLTAGGAWKEETVWNGDGAGGGGCSTVLQAPPWQQSLPDWSAVGCGAHRAVTDVSADADPYTGVSIYDSTPVVEAGVEYKGWTMIGGTSVASPIIAATYGLAGGAGTEPGGGAVAYPARTLYENLAFAPSALHDVKEGSNGACAKGFDEATGLSECSTSEEGESCSQQAICVARPGYDGPTGVGTPDGIAAFEPLSEANRKLAEEKLAKQKVEEERREREARELRESEERKRHEEEAAAQKRKEEKEVAEQPLRIKEAEERALVKEAEEQALKTKEAEEQKVVEQLAATAAKLAAEVQVARERAGSISSGSATTSTHTPSAVLSSLALAPSARSALGHGRPPASELAFTFTANAATRVHAVISRRVVVDGRRHWHTLSYSLTLSAVAGPNTARLSGHGHLDPGVYQLTLTPAGGIAQTLAFRVA